MIADSIPWKVLLARKAASLLKRTKQRRWPDASMALLEQDIMLSAYAVRRLIEAYKISDEFMSTAVGAVAYTFRRERRFFVDTGDLPDFMNWHRIEEFYDLQKGQHVHLGLQAFCNQVIHSYIFMFTWSDDGMINGFAVSSDRARGERLLMFDLEETAKLLRGVASDDIVSSDMHRDEKTGQWKFTRRSRHHRPEDEEKKASP